MVLLSVDLHLALRVLVVGCLTAAGLGSIPRHLLLTGPDAVRAIEWTDTGQFTLELGRGRWRQATLNRASRYGVSLWILDFDTPDGCRMVLIDTGSQRPGPVRGLVRRLELIPSPAKV